MKVSGLKPSRNVCNGSVKFQSISSKETAKLSVQCAVFLRHVLSTVMHMMVLQEEREAVAVQRIK